MVRTWLPDPSHYPEQLTPLSATTWFEAVGTGLHRAMRLLRAPFGGFQARTHLGWAYEGELDPEWDSEPTVLHRAAMDLPARWEAEHLPRVHAITEELHSLRPERPPPTEAARALAHLWELMLEQWTIHFLVVVPAQIAVESLHDAYVEAFQPEDPLVPYRLLEGVPNESAEADRQLSELAERAKALGLADVIREYPPSLVPDTLAGLQDGRRWLHELDRYLLRYGGRSRWHELSLPREVESPNMTLESIRLFLEGRGRPNLARAQEAARLEAVALGARPALGAIVEAAKVGYALKESHVYHIDYPGLLAVREALLGFGRRLLADGRLQALDDVWMLRRAELEEAVGAPGVDVSDLVAERWAELAEGLGRGPEPFLGRPPERGERHAALEKFYGSARPETGGRWVRGTGASPGVGEGPVRVVAGPLDFRRVRPGDVLVATTTTPAWTPLFPSHAAIVAREYGIPAVVGADGATRILVDGVRVRVDGRTGEVAPA